MTPFLESLQNFFTRLQKGTDAALKPSINHTESAVEQEINFRRNRAVFLSCIYAQIFYVCNILFNKAPLLETLLRSSGAAVILILLLLSHRIHPQILKFSFFMITLIIGPAVLKTGAEGVTTAFIGVGLLPIFTQILTGSDTYYIIQAIAQGLFLNTLYQGYFEELIELNSPGTVVRCLTYSTNVVSVLLFFLHFLVNRILLQTQKEAYVLEQKKNEAETQKTFLLSFSHELRNLINSLTGNVKLASLENVGGRAKDFLLNAEVCGELLLQLVNNILDTGKAALGELEINPVPTKTYDAFERIWGICSELIKRKDLGGFIKISKKLPSSVMIDNHRLTQIFINLVGNAIKFTDYGSIDITIDWMDGKDLVEEECFQPYPFNSSDDYDEGLFEKQQGFFALTDSFFALNAVKKNINRDLISPTTHSSRGILKMIVSDKGCGMTKEQTKRLFQKFTQVTCDASKKKLGTGLGLFISRELCEKMNGKIRVFSEKDKGSSFIFCIPVKVIQENTQLLQDQVSLKAQLAAKKLRAMIVDDAPANHFILEGFFDKLGVEVVDIAVNGLEAYQKYSNRNALRKFPDIVAMDLDMPIMNGKEASQKIRELEKKNRLKPCFLIIISGNCIDSEISECLSKSGKIRADAFLQKPLRSDDLRRVLTSHFIGGE